MSKRKAESKEDGSAPAPKVGRNEITCSGPSNSLVDPLLTDLYQISMAYAYWKCDRHEEDSVFDLFFRKPPFKGEFTIFCGLEECLRFVSSYKFSPAHLDFLKNKFSEWDQGFFDYLAGIDCSTIKIYAVPEGSVVFPRVPLIRLEGPVLICQLLETTLLCLVNYPSLVATNAARHRLAVGPEKQLLEFGLRRAQGPDGAMSASRYAYIGGFDGTSNVSAASKWGIECKGTHAHSFVTSFMNFDDLKNTLIKDPSGADVEFVSSVNAYRKKLGKETNIGELAAFVAYAQAYPKGFLALIDSYDTLNSGVYNMLAVSLALNDLGYKPIGIRLDSGDLAYLSKECRRIFIACSKQFNVDFQKLMIVASNDICEPILYSLKEQGHEIDCFGIGTHLVTCKAQPALGCVYKLVEIRGKPRIKISQDIEKITIPGRKEAYRLFNEGGEPLVDLLVHVGSNAPVKGRKILCRHPFMANKRVYVTPSKVELLHELVWDGKLVKPFPTVTEVRDTVKRELAKLRTDVVRSTNPTPYKLSVTDELYNYVHNLWLQECPITSLE